jgi:hypothetical protein
MKVINNEPDFDLNTVVGYVDVNKAIEVFKDYGSDGFLKRAEENLASIG